MESDIVTSEAYGGFRREIPCSAVKFKGGTGVSLQFAIDWGYKACPHCQPPTSVTPGTEDNG